MTAARTRSIVLGLALAAMAVPVVMPAQGRQSGERELPSIADKTSEMQRIEGFFPLYWDDQLGQLWMEIPSLNTEVLHLDGLAAGLGSNDIGLDRAQLRGDRIVEFQRVGRKVLMVQPNYRFRAATENAAEHRDVEEAFAPSVLWGFTAAAETGNRVLVEVTDFLLRDPSNIARQLRPGTYRLDKDRSAVYMPMTRGFPKNTEMEVQLTFVRQPSTGGGSGQFGGGSDFEGVSDVAATGEAATLRVHYSFVELPEPGYEPREADPRAGYGAMTYHDYAVPLGESMTRRFIRRHRLAKVDPSASVSDPVEPIVYYLDPGTPEPVRSALLDGARWWNQAFEAAGYRNAFRVEMLPDGVSPLDIRYNVINWVHRSTRGWSYGRSVVDPRTGEIIKGIVTLGSLRIRQDYMIAEGLLAPYEDGTETPPELAVWALARIRQLSAHEVGHTIGLSHNYYDSQAGRISVMDYPHPLITLDADGSFDYSQVYDDKIGEWDKVAIAYGYQDFQDGADEQQALTAILDEAWERDIRFFTNQDIATHPRADQWSNGTNAANELNRMMDVRRAALSRFGENTVKLRAPLATLEEVLVPLYLHHRYQVDAAASVVGGVDYIYAMRGDNREPQRPASASDQRAALDALARTLAPRELALPENVVHTIPPRPPSYGMHRELFPRNTGLVFDAISPATVAADHSISQVLESRRAARLIQQHALDSSLPGLNDVIDVLFAATFDANTSSPYEAEIKRAVERVLIDRLIRLANNAAMPQVRAIANLRLQRKIDELKVWPGDVGDAVAAHYALLVRDAERFLTRPAPEFEPPVTASAPPGAPIGDPALDWLNRMAPWCSWTDGR